MHYQRGDRVALVYTNDAHTDLKPNDKGTVHSFNESEKRLEVDWDNGSTLSMLFEDGDRVRKV